MTLKIRGHAHPTTNIFQLNGIDENSATFALGWVLEQCAGFRKSFVEAIFNKELDVGAMTIEVQRHRENGGFTDVELHMGAEFHAILEAKRGRAVATEKQLESYHPRLKPEPGAARLQRFVSVSSADPASAATRLPAHVKGVEVIHLSWDNICQLAKDAYADGPGNTEKLWLRAFVTHLKEFVAMDRANDNQVFCVALGTREAKRAVREDLRYTALAENSPDPHPNYIGFRYDAVLKSVHYVDKCTVVQKLNEETGEMADHILYELGQPMTPPTAKPSAGVFPNGRFWCAIDTLLSTSFPTIRAALDESKRRLGYVPPVPDASEVLEGELANDELNGTYLPYSAGVDAIKTLKNRNIPEGPAHVFCRMHPLNRGRRIHTLRSFNKHARALQTRRCSYSGPNGITIRRLEWLVQNSSASMDVAQWEAAVTRAIAAVPRREASA